ncbi:MAG: hypothetical protein QOG21_1257 [Actinomycetota bacterium]|nr:hypothetical protein [Actinomycetota bacterium]
MIVEPTRSFIGREDDKPDRRDPHAAHVVISSFHQETANPTPTHFGKNQEAIDVSDPAGVPYLARLLNEADDVAHCFVIDLGKEGERVWLRQPFKILVSNQGTGVRVRSKREPRHRNRCRSLEGVKQQPEIDELIYAVGSRWDYGDRRAHATG